MLNEKPSHQESSFTERGNSVQSQDSGTICLFLLPHVFPPHPPQLGVTTRGEEQREGYSSRRKQENKHWSRETDTVAAHRVRGNYSGSGRPHYRSPPSPPPPPLPTTSTTPFPFGQVKGHSITMTAKALDNERENLVEEKQTLALFQRTCLTYKIWGTFFCFVFGAHRLPFFGLNQTQQLQSESFQHFHFLFPKAPSGSSEWLPTWGTKSPATAWGQLCYTTYPGGNTSLWGSSYVSDSLPGGLSIYLTSHVSIYLSLSVSLSIIHPPSHLFIRLCVNLISPSICLSLSVCLSIHLYLSLTIHPSSSFRLSIRLSISQFLSLYLFLAILSMKY